MKRYDFDDMDEAEECVRDRDETIAGQIETIGKLRGDNAALRAERDRLTLQIKNAANILRTESDPMLAIERALAVLSA